MSWVVLVFVGVMVILRLSLGIDFYASVQLFHFLKCTEKGCKGKTAKKRKGV